MLFTYRGYAQAPRTMLYEQSTSGDCVNCPYANRLVDPVLLANFKKVVALKYQAPQPGGDVMYWQNPTEVDAVAKLVPSCAQTSAFHCSKN